MPQVAHWVIGAEVCPIGNGVNERAGCNQLSHSAQECAVTQYAVVLSPSAAMLSLAAGLEDNGAGLRSGSQQHPHPWPFHADWPSLMRMGMASKAAIESNHGIWNAALSARPARVMSAM